MLDKKVEIISAAVFAVLATLSNSFLGGWDKAIQLLWFLMIIDYATGIVAAFKNKKLNSDVMFWGGVRKFFSLVVIALSAVLDGMISDHVPIFRTAAVYFYSGREGLSVVENLGILGVWLPKPLKDRLEQLQDKGDGTDDSGKKGV